MKKIENVVIVESNMTNAEHLSFNTCVLNELKENNEIVFYCSKSHADFLPQELKEKIQLKKISVIQGKERRFIKKAIIDFFNLLSIISANRTKKIIFLSVFPPSLVFLSFLKCLFSADVTVYLHGELVGLNERNKSKITSYGFWIKKYFKSTLYKRLKNIVVGKHIKESLKKISYIDLESISFINHPITLSKYITNKNIKFASIGYASGNSYDELFSSISKMNLYFEHIGMVSDDIFQKYNGSNIRFHVVPGEALSYKKYSMLISCVQFGVFLYNDDYSFTTSGAMLDAVSSNVIIMTANNMFAKYLKDQKYPVMLFNSSQDLLCSLSDRLNYEAEISSSDIEFTQRIFMNLSNEGLL